MRTTTNLAAPDAQLEQALAILDQQPRPSVAQRFLRSQVVNTQRDLAALRPFRPTEFGAGPASPSAAHIQAANQLITHLRGRLQTISTVLDHEAERGGAAPTTANLQAILAHRQAALSRAKAIERIWQFYLELFGQRQSRFADMLLGMDRIALDCYQAIYTGLGAPRSIPSPAPFSYMETGFTPATYRRGIRLTRLGRNLNPFPVVQLPNHRLINPWTLGAVHHEVAHNLQHDLGLWNVVPRQILARLLQAGAPPVVAQTWARWHKEIWADLAGALLGGPGVVVSLLDVLGRTPAAALHFSPTGVHPTPYLRTLINTELLRRMGFRRQASELEQLWRRMYPRPEQGNIPRDMLGAFPEANRLVVDTICYQPHPNLGGKQLAQVFCFDQSHEQMTQEAAQRIAHGVDPGIMPARFLVGAVRHAFDQQLAPPSQIARNFYGALSRR